MRTHYMKTPPTPDPRSPIKTTGIKSTAGVWIDHQKAVISIISVEGEKTLEIRSDIQKPATRLTGSPMTPPPALPCDPAGKPHRYYDAVLAVIGNVESLLLFGPGEAKQALKKRFEGTQPRRHIITLKPPT